MSGYRKDSTGPARDVAGRPDGAQAPRHAAAAVRVPAPGPGERFAWRFGPGDRFAFLFDPDAGDGERRSDRVVFRVNGGEVTLLGPCEAACLREVTIVLPDGAELPLDALVSDDSAVDAIARSLIARPD